MRLDMYAGRYVDDPHALMLCPRARRVDFFFRLSGRLVVKLLDVSRCQTCVFLALLL